MYHKIVKVFVFLLFSTTLLTAYPFGSPGHQAVGALADHLIAGKRAQSEVNRLLGGLNLETVAVWADCAKGVHRSDGGDFVYQDDPQYAECAPFSNKSQYATFENFVSRNWKQCGATHGHEYCHNQYHYTDVSNDHAAYTSTLVGTNDHDVVHSINAAIAVLKDQEPKAPIDLRDKQGKLDKREALMLLAHYVGDIHQPLHVEAVYLDADGSPIDPDSAGDQPGNETAGGNAIKDGRESLHHEWDQIPSSLQVNGKRWKELLKAAQSVSETTGNINTWSASWATDTILAGKGAFENLTFSLASDIRGPHGTFGASEHHWIVSGIDSDYKSRAEEIKFQQLAKAGARLAQVLEVIWPDDGTTPLAALKNSPIPDANLARVGR